MDELHADFPPGVVLIKNEAEIIIILRKNYCGISRGLGFWPWNFQDRV